MPSRGARGPFRSKEISIRPLNLSSKISQNGALANDLKINLHCMLDRYRSKQGAGGVGGPLLYGKKVTSDGFS